MGKQRGTSGEYSGWVTTDVAAAALEVTPRTVRNLIQRGELDAKVEGEGVEKTYSVPISSLEYLRDTRKNSGNIPRKVRAISGDTELAEIVSDLQSRLESLQFELGRAQARAELTERAESTLREDVERERQERSEAQRKVEHLEQERLQAQEEARQLREELEVERAKGFWRRLFGG